MLAKKFWLPFGLLALSMIATGCGGGGSGSVGVGIIFANTWYDFYGRPCGSSPYPGCDYYNYGGKINSQNDPFFFSNGPLNPFDSWISPDGIYYFGGFAVNATQDESGRDVIADIATMENEKVQRAGEKFAAKYALSEAKSLEMARTLFDFAIVSGKRARTEADQRAFLKNMTGISAEKGLAAIELAQKGNRSGLESLNDDIAGYWGTTPETSQRVLKTWFKEYLPVVGVK